MTITIHGYTERGEIDATIDGRRITVPDAPGNRHRRDIAEWEAEGNTIPAYAPPTPTAEDVRAEAARRLEAIARPYSPAERETWAAQVDEARAVQGGATTSALLEPLAEARGITLAQMADRVMQRRDDFAAGSAAVLKAQTQILAMDPIPADFAADARWPGA